MNDLNFDRYQFEGRGAFPASAETSIAWTDYGRMHTEFHNANPAAYVPPFALNNSQLKSTLLLRAWHSIGGKGLPTAPDRDEINRAATAKALRGNRCIANVGAPSIQREMVKKHAAAVRKAGGYLQLLAAIAFRSWRLGMNSIEVAQSLDMTPCQVRVNLWRMRDAAKKLGFDCGRPGVTAGMKRKRKRKSRA